MFQSLSTRVPAGWASSRSSNQAGATSSSDACDDDGARTPAHTAKMAARGECLALQDPGRRRDELLERLGDQGREHQRGDGCHPGRCDRDRAAEPEQHQEGPRERSPFDRDEQDDREHRQQRDGIGLGEVGGAPLVEVLGPRSHGEEGGVDPRAERRGHDDGRRPERDQEQGAELTCGHLAFEGKPGDDSERDDDRQRPHAVQGRPHPRHEDQPPACLAVADGRQPGGGDDDNEQIAEHLWPGREARAGRGAGQDRGEGRGQRRRGDSGAA